MNFRIILIGIFLLQAVSVEAQTLSKTISVPSKILGDDREIEILLPENYSGTGKYPVIYITDANYNFEIPSNYITQLIKFDAIPEAILVGIIQKNRGQEMDVFLSQSGLDFQDFISKELIPFVDANYNTSGFNSIVGHSDGAEFNHLLMITKDNPFRGFVNISENLNNDVIAEISSFFQTYSGKKIYYFIASGKYDSPYRIDAGKLIQNQFLSSKNTSVVLTNTLYEADHQNLIAKSLVDAISFIFQDYRDLSTYSNFKEYVNNYKNKIENNYGFIPTTNENDIDYYFGEILDAKNIAMYEYIVEYTATNDIFKTSNYDRAWHYFYMDQHLESVKYWNRTLDDFQETNSRIFYYNFTKAIESYLILEDPKGAIAFLEKCKIKLPEHKLSFNYFISKVAIENKIENRLAAKNLRYCEQNYVENRYFNKEDLKALKNL